MSIEYSGRQKFERPRKLSEIEGLEHYKDRIEFDAFGTIDERDQFTDGLYTDLAKVYLKGEVVKDALSNMNPAQFIPIEEGADPVRAAAIRIASEASENGTIITYSMFQKCVDIMLAKKWELRGTVIGTKIPASVYERSSQTTQKLSNSKGVDDWLKEFIDQNGIVTTILGVLTMSPFQAPIFQALGVENASKGVQVAQIPVGIAIFLELGIKAERIYKMLRAAKISTPAVENAIAALENSPENRAQAFDSIGINYEEFKKSQEFQDSEIIINYVREYYGRYGGVDRPNGHLSLDHWIAYLQVAQNQQIVRGALNTSSSFSPKFRSFKDQFDPPLEDPTDQNQNIYTNNNKKTSKMFNDFASVTRALKDSSDEMYDNIVNVLAYRLTDKDLCCLVQIFGQIGDPNVMLGVASILRILAVGLGAELNDIFNLIAKLIANLLQDALFELMAKFNEFYYKIAYKITKAFTIDVDNLTACVGMLSLGWALLQGLQALFDQIMALLKEIMSLIGEFGLGKNIKWEVAGDRRHLLGVARILEVLAYKLELANSCAINRDQKITNITEDFDNRQANVDEAIFTILESKDPVIQVSPENLQKYFPNIAPKTSERLKFTYGITSQQNNETNTAKCDDPDQQERIQSLIKNITSSLQESFNG
jgi:hypothetical protein